MYRYITKDLKTWKESANRKPLILLGARQVGKTYSLKQFGREEFENMVYVNCHNNPFVESLFFDFDIDRILYQLSLHYEERIVSGKTLLFFDEIQEIKNGIPSLKYFCENKDAHGVLVLPITLSALAERIGIGRASLYRVIDSLEEKKDLAITINGPEYYIDNHSEHSSIGLNIGSGISCGVYLVENVCRWVSRKNIFYV